MEKHLHNVLVIDDDADILSIAKLSLEMLGEYKVTTFTSATEALVKASDYSPDAIVLDVTMPEIDGVTLMNMMKENPKLADVPFIFMTARLSAHEVKDYYREGASGVVAKPFDPMAIDKSVHDIFYNQVAHILNQEIFGRSVLN